VDFQLEIKFLWCVHGEDERRKRKSREEREECREKGLHGLEEEEKGVTYIY